MSEKTGDKNFQRMAIGLMALTGIGTLLHLCHQIYLDLKPKREKGESRHSDRPPGQYRQDDEPPQPGRPDQSWVTRAGVSERTADGEKRWTEHNSRQPQARQR